MPTPEEILQETFETVIGNIENHHIEDSDKRRQIEYVCRNLQNRSGVRFLMACLLAKLHQPNLDIRMPYTEIGGDDC